MENEPGKCNSMEDKRPDCDLEFKRLWDKIEKEIVRVWVRLEKGDLKFEEFADKEHEQDKELVSLKTHMLHLVSSMSNLTKAIWGMVASILLVLISFFIWYVQNGNH
jgi:hypothetical protein